MKFLHFELKPVLNPRLNYRSIIRYKHLSIHCGGLYIWDTMNLRLTPTVLYFKNNQQNFIFRPFKIQFQHKWSKVTWESHLYRPIQTKYPHCYQQAHLRATRKSFVLWGWKINVDMLSSHGTFINFKTYSWWICDGLRIKCYARVILAVHARNTRDRRVNLNVSYNARTEPLYC